MAIMWNVFASFGYNDAVVSQNGDSDDEINRYAIDEGLKCKLVLKNCTTPKAMAEFVAVATEAALAVEYDDFKIDIKCSEQVGDLLYLFSLDEYIDFSEGEFQFKGYNGDYLLFEGKKTDNDLICEFDLICASQSVAESHIGAPVPETIIFAEADAEGIAYEISYTMRLSGCLVTNYLGNGDIKDCQKYAQDKKIESIIRVFADGKIQIKDSSVSGGITETDYETFVGYYNEPEEEHGHHHHGEDCDCGHCH